MRSRVFAALLLAAVCGLAAAQQPASVVAQPTDAPAPLPDIQTTLTRVRARYDALESLRKSYICAVTQVADEFSGDGAKKTHTDEYQAFFVGHTEIFQHVARDGRPLSPDDARKEQERVDKLVAKLKSGDYKPPKNEFRLSSALKLATVTNARREVIDERPTLVFDYRGDPHAKAEGLGDEIMRELAGTLWVDEREDAIVRFTGTLQQNFHVGGGLLVNVKKGSWIEFRQSRVNGEIWFPVEFAVHVDGRFLLLKGFNGDLRDTFSDYRKLKTSVTILPGAQVIESTNGSAPDSSEPKP